MNDKPFSQKPFVLYFLLLLSGIVYYFLSYQTLRENFTQVISLFAFLFVIYFVVFRYFSITHFKQLMIAGILFRIFLLFSIPNLSDDVYRFIWDGRLASNGMNPFSYLPSEIMQMPPVQGITKELFEKLNSPNYYTIYPPVMEGVFWMAGKLFSVNVFGSIIFLKGIIILFELATFYLLLQLLKKLSLPKHLSLLYILNPLVITELTGNAHFEGVMIFFVLLSFLLLFQNKWQVSAIFLGAGVATKLIPVLFLPLIFYKLGWRKGLLYSLITGVITLLLFAIVFDIATVQHMLSSIDLFFRKFEFNASIYYLVRHLVTLVQGYNMIVYSGPFLTLVSSFIILVISFKRKNISSQLFFDKALFIITTWFLFATTVHPWYICFPVVLAVFTNYRYAIIWSFTATLSYAAYQTNPVKENLWLVGIGYIITVVYFFWELQKKNNSIGSHII